MILFLCLVWICFVIGVTIGWAWKPKWPIFNIHKLESSASNSTFPSKSLPLELDFPSEKHLSASSSTTGFDHDHSRGTIVELDEGNSNEVSEDDLVHLCHLVEEKDGGPTWIPMMDRSTPTMAYKAWRRDPKIGPPQYRISTVFENATPEIVRDFFWDDEFRPNWDDMLVSSATVKECPTTGTMVVQWIRKFPFFCKDREYIIGRRIWESGRWYYCVTKRVPCPSIPRNDKPRRVDLYYSSWCIRAVESMSGDGQLSTCEVLLFHHEDMGIPWEIAKLGVRKGMWGLVKKMEPGLRAYQRQRALGLPISQAAFMANINTKINPDGMTSLGERAVECSSETRSETEPQKPQGLNIPKVLIIGGAIILACSLNQGLLTKTLVFCVARRFGNVGKRL